MGLIRDDFFDQNVIKCGSYVVLYKTYMVISCDTSKTYTCPELLPAFFLYTLLDMRE